MKRKEADDMLRIATRTVNALTEAKRRLPNLLARDTEGPGRDGYSQGGGGPGRVSDPRPTEQTAVALVEKGPLPDPYHEELVALSTWLTKASATAAGITLSIAKLDRMGAVATSNTLQCANPACDEVITRVGNDRPRRGRCRRCYEYLSDHDRDWTPRADRQGAA